MRVEIHAEIDTELPPELIRNALLDFTERRLDIWSDTLDPATFRVHSVGETTAVVTEGTRRPKVWSRERYDWSKPGTITWTTEESNFCTPRSFIRMDITPNPTGGSHIAVEWNRSPSNLRGRLYLTVAALGGQRLLAWATRHALNGVAKRMRD